MGTVAPKKDTDQIKGPWGLEEDQRLQNFVEEHRPQNWSLMSRSIPGRSGKSCRLRWCNQLSPQVTGSFVWGMLLLPLLLRHRARCFVVFLCCVLAISFPVLISAGVVTLDSIKIYKTHEWLNFKPTIYLKCKGENETELPDVKKKKVLYTFKGEESWQPLTNLTGKNVRDVGSTNMTP